ncbi:MAG: Rab proteins geranylgeranyltransferase component A [Candelina submexicana]|nr:MAG: Rab proteins geranylgeranyltransferase component A [Candelina submexicana]
MESLEDTTWDVLIAGTGLQQSLLALALSRSGKKILHVDRNTYYGGAHAAFSLQEAQDWVNTINSHDGSSSFADATIEQPTKVSGIASSSDPTTLSFSRAYSLSLSPQVIYTRSTLLPHLVSSKIYRQLDFQAVGSWWIYVSGDARASGASAQDSSETSSGRSQGDKQAGCLRRVPNGREDVFADKSIDLKSKRSLMKFLKFVGDYEDQPENWKSQTSSPFPEFLSTRFGLPAALHGPLLALTLTPNKPQDTTTGFALPRIARHLRSIGVFGPGFASVVAKWGGGSEIAQVACRAAAVGGAVYVLGNGIQSIDRARESLDRTQEAEESKELVEVILTRGEKVRTNWIIGGDDDIPLSSTSTLHPPTPSDDSQQHDQRRSISVVSSSLSSLFPVLAEGAPPPAASVVIFPSESLSETLGKNPSDVSPPVHILAHSSDTGECPSGQCVLYASVTASADYGYGLLDIAIKRLLDCAEEKEQPTEVLWSMHYQQQSQRSTLVYRQQQPGSKSSENVLVFPSLALDLAFDDIILEQVRGAWQKITAVDPESGFMVFEDRHGFETDANNGD